MKAALYVAGRVVVGDSHLSCLSMLQDHELDGELDSGFYDDETREFISEREQRIFDNKELYLVRHGHYLGDHELDPDIDGEGEGQVRGAAEVLRGRDLADFAGVTSPLLRCLRTASILQELLGIHFRVVPEVIETPHFLDPGKVFKLKNRSRDFPQLDWPTSKEWHVLPETEHDFLLRVKDSLQRMPTRSIVVTHHGYISLTAKISLCKNLFQGAFPHASVTYFHRQDGQRLGRTNEEILSDRPPAPDRQG